MTFFRAVPAEARHNYRFAPFMSCSDGALALPLLPEFGRELGTEVLALKTRVKTASLSAAEAHYFLRPCFFAFRRRCRVSAGTDFPLSWRFFICS